MQNAQITLLIPELDNTVWQTLKAKLPAWQLLLKRATPEVLIPSSYESLLYQLFNVDTTQASATAAITGLADGLGTEKGYWLRADPVCLQADLSAVYLIGNAALAITQQEADGFKQELLSFLWQDGLALHTPDARRWYLQSAVPLEISTTNLTAATGKNIADYLPQGNKLYYWRQLFTELQMLLHRSATNQQRIHQHLPAINGLWLWGEGQLPANIKAPWHAVWSDEPLLAGLAKLAGIPLQSPPSTANTIIKTMKANQYYLINPLLETTMSAEDRLIQLETHWFQPLVTALQKKQLQRVTIYSGNNKLLHINCKTIRYFWRRNS